MDDVIECDEVGLQEGLTLGLHDRISEGLRVDVALGDALGATVGPNQRNITFILLTRTINRMINVA